MKAEHRKELQTNVLADRMGRLVQTMKSGSRPNTIILWIIALLAVGTIAAWGYFSKTRESRSASWVKLDGDYNPISLDEIARENKGTMPGRTARFQRARVLLRSGLQSIYSFDRTESIKTLEDARKLYTELISECADNVQLVQEALLGAAKAEEALVGVPQQDKADEHRGSLDQALKLYQRLMNTPPENEMTREAARRAKQIEENKEQMEKFYEELNNKLKKPK